MKSVIHGLVLPREVPENQPLGKFEHKYPNELGKSFSSPGLTDRICNLSISPSEESQKKW